jgi:hypothetical protein
MWSGDSAAFDESDDSHHGWQGPFMAPPAPAPSCPHCGSNRLAQRHLGRRILGVVGTLAGATGAAVRAWRGAELGGTVGAVAGPPGVAVGAIAGAVLGALAGGSTGCAVGVRLGDAIDSRLLNDLHCLDCGQGFSSTRLADSADD